MTPFSKSATWLFFTALLSPSSAVAGADTAAILGQASNSSNTSPSWESSFQAGFLSQQESDFDGGGTYSVNRANLSADFTRVYDRRRTIGLSLEYGYDGYDFNAAAGDPWSDVHSVNVGLPIRWSLTGAWGLIAIPTLRSAAESGADVSESITGGFLGGVSYRFGDRLTLGPGFGVISQIEDDTSIFPILLIQWKITDSLKLETGRGLGASQGPGLSLNWQVSDDWRLSLGSRYERLRFRRADTNFTDNYIGEEEGIPIYLGASYTISKSSELSIYTGARVGGSIAIEDDQGNPFTSSDVDATSFTGIVWKQKF